MNKAYKVFETLMLFIIGWYLNDMGYMPPFFPTIIIIFVGGLTYSIYEINNERNSEALAWS